MKKIKNNKSFIIVILLIMVILGEGIFIFLNSNKQLDSSKGDIPKEENNEVDDHIDKVDVTDETRDLVYDASYDLPTNEESYCISVDCTERVYAKDLVVPFINIDSDYAREVNREIYELYKELVDIYNENAAVGTWYTLVHYDYYILDNILSVVITTTSGGTDVQHYQYYVYTFNLDSENKASYEEVYSKANISSDNIDALVKDAITSTMREELEGLKDPLIDTGDGVYFPDGTNFDTFNNGSFDNYLTSVQNNTLKYFLDGNGKLNVIVSLLIPAGTGEFDTVITIS